jgi:O-antigen/teichoic acid export membrane protein
MATLFTLPLSLLGRTIETVLLPRASSKQEFELGRFAALAALIAVGCVAAYQIGASRMVTLLFGSGNDQAVAALRMLSLGFSAILVYSVFSAFIFGRAPRPFLKKLVAVTFLQALVIAPALNIYLVGEMGLVGAAWATNVSLLIQAGLWTGAGLFLRRGAGAISG